MYLVIFLLAAATICSALIDPTPWMLYPIPSVQFRPYQLVTYAFFHSSALHLALNLIALLSFGPSLIRAWGVGRFLACYGLAAALGGAMQATHSTQPVVGASAALFGLFAAFVMLNPRRKVLSLIPRPLEAWKVLATYVGVSLLAIIFDMAAGVAHTAHLGGVLVGVCFALAHNDKPHR